MTREQWEHLGAYEVGVVKATVTTRDGSYSIVLSRIDPTGQSRAHIRFNGSEKSVELVRQAIETVVWRATELAREHRRTT